MTRLATAKKWIGCPISKAWKWWAEPSPGRRLAAWLLICAVVAWGAAALQDYGERTREIVNQQAQDRAVGRLENAADKFALCQVSNQAAISLDTGWVTLGQLFARPDAPPDTQERLAAAVDRLRSTVPGELDCANYLSDLTPAQRAEVQATTVPPTLPRARSAPTSATTIHQ